SVPQDFGHCPAIALPRDRRRPGERAHHPRMRPAPQRELDGSSPGVPGTAEQREVVFLVSRLEKAVSDIRISPVMRDSDFHVETADPPGCYVTVRVDCDPAPRAFR